mgnify:FL=1
MQLVKFKRGDRAWYLGEWEVELYSMKVIDGKVMWNARAIGTLSARTVPQDHLSERALSAAERRAAGYLFDAEH